MVFRDVLLAVLPPDTDEGFKVETDAGTGLCADSIKVLITN